MISWRRFQAFDLFWLVRYDMTFIISSKRIAGKLVQTVSYYFLLIDGAGGHVNKQVCQPSGVNVMSENYVNSTSY